MWSGTGVYGGDIRLQAPTEVMDWRRADALDGVVRRGLHALNEALQYYEEQRGRYPDTLTPETVGNALEALGFIWPTNPFKGNPMRHAPASPETIATPVTGTTTLSSCTAGTTRSRPERRRPVE